MLRLSVGNPLVVVLPTALDVAEQNRFELLNHGVKNRCLTTWLLLYMVRDRVLETLCLTASELKSDVSANSTNPADGSDDGTRTHTHFCTCF